MGLGEAGFSPGRGCHVEEQAALSQILVRTLTRILHAAWLWY